MEEKDIPIAQQFCSYRGVPTEKSTPMWKARLTLTEDHSLMIELDNTPVGFIVLDKDKHLYEIGIHIAQEYRGKGIGKEAMRLLMEYCKQNGVKKLYAKVNPKNEISMKLLDKTGFKPVYVLMGKMVEG